MGITLHVLHVDSLCDKPNIFLEQMDTWDIKVKFWILLRNLAKFGLIWTDRKKLQYYHLIALQVKNKQRNKQL